MRVTILGCGGSAGVPQIGCDCEVCRSDNPKNKRSRVSVSVEIGTKRLLIDVSPDMRAQALRNDIRHVDAVLYTHDHADHTQGTDELRNFNQLANKPLDIYATRATLDSLQQRFAYAFKKPSENGIWYTPCLVPHALPDSKNGGFSAAGVEFSYFTQGHGRTTSLGYRIGNMAYSTDVNHLSEESFAALRGLEVWIVDCLRYSTSPSHANLEMALGWIARVKPKLAVLTHMAHELDYERLSTELPPGVVPAYDGMVLEIGA